MKIEKVIINNFKCLRDIHLPLNNLTLLTGVNSSGKSSFIQALLLLKQNEEAVRTALVLQSVVKHKQSNDITKSVDTILEKISTFILDGEYLSLGDVKSLLYQESFNEPITIQLNFTNKEFLKISLDSDSKFLVSNNTKNNAIDDKALERFNGFYYVCTDRAVPSITYPLSDKHMKNDSIGLKGEYTTHYLAQNRRKLLSIKELKHPDSTTEQLLENVSAWLGEISHGIEVLATIHKQLQVAALTYQYTYGDQTTGKYTPLNIGFGVTYVLPIIVAILKSAPGDLLIIENPESHLHPAGQSKVAELCAIAASCGVQIIIESHSDHFFNGVRVAIKNKILEAKDSQIYFFQKEQQRLETTVQALNVNQSGRIDEWPKGFFDEWDNKLNELLW